MNREAQIKKWREEAKKEFSRTFNIEEYASTIILI
jgi:hypothetical protein